MNILSLFFPTFLHVIVVLRVQAPPTVLVDFNFLAYKPTDYLKAEIIKEF